MAQENLRSECDPNLLNIPIKNILPPNFFSGSCFFRFHVIDAYHGFIFPVSYRFPGWFGMFLLVFVGFPRVFLLFSLIISHVLYFRFFVKNSTSQIFVQNPLILSDYFQWTSWVFFAIRYSSTKGRIWDYYSCLCVVRHARLHPNLRRLAVGLLF